MLQLVRSAADLAVFGPVHLLAGSTAVGDRLAPGAALELSNLLFEGSAAEPAARGARVGPVLGNHPIPFLSDQPQVVTVLLERLGPQLGLF